MSFLVIFRLDFGEIWSKIWNFWVITVQIRTKSASFDFRMTSSARKSAWIDDVTIFHFRSNWKILIKKMVYFLFEGLFQRRKNYEFFRVCNFSCSPAPSSHSNGHLKWLLMTSWWLIPTSNRIFLAWFDQGIIIFEILIIFEIIPGNECY